MATNHELSSTVIFPPRINEKYQINHKCLGEGTTATVYSATVIATQQKVALKVFQKKGLSPDAVRLLRQEYEILSSIQHPNIIQAYELISDENDAYYMSLEFMSGGELFDRIKLKKNYSEKDARDLVKVLLDAIKYIHSKDIIHRDLKPENLLLTSPHEDINVKIADFGAAIRAHGFTAIDLCGTYAYLAPEIVERRPYGAPVDIWAFGVILYVLLGGYQPFFGENRKELKRRIRNVEYQFHEAYWSTVSENAKDLIRKLLVFNPNERYTAEQAADHIWLQQEDSELACQVLTENLKELSKFQVRMKFKGAVNAVIFSNRLKRVRRDANNTIIHLTYRGLSINSNILSLIEGQIRSNPQHAKDETELRTKRSDIVEEIGTSETEAEIAMSHSLPKKKRME